MKRCGLTLARCRPALFLILFLPLRSIAQDVWIETKIYMSDGVALDTRIVKPLGFPPSGGFPGIILIHGYGGNKDPLQAVQVLIATYGYASLAYSVRGQGNSEGLSTTAGPREREDLQSVIQYFRGTSNINPNKIGIAGGSQGGIHAWMAAAYRMPGVKAVAPLVATPDFAEALVPNGCVKYGLQAEMTLNSVRYSAERDRIKELIIADEYDSIMTYIRARDLAQLLDSVQIPVMQGLGWQDILFPVNGGVRAAKNLSDRGIPIWSYFGTNGHGAALDPLGAILALDITVQWFDHWMKGFSLENASVPMVFYSDDQSSNQEWSATSWPPPGATTRRLYLTGGGLSPSPPAAGTSHTIPFTLEYDTAYTPAMGWDDTYDGAAFLQAFQSTPARFVSPPLPKAVMIAGTPKGRIVVQSEGRRFQAHVRLFDVGSDVSGGAWTLFSRSINGFRENTPGSVRELMFEASAIAHNIPSGNRIGVEITSLDMLSDSRANTLPYFEGTHSFLLASGDQPSWVELDDMTPGELFVGEIGDAELPVSFALEQNYPNPFNPETVIRFALPASVEVKLVVYDLLGREVKRIAEGTYAAGPHEVRFSGVGLASGNYFYRLQAGEQIQTRRMILAR